MCLFPSSCDHERRTYRNAMDHEHDNMSFISDLLTEHYYAIEDVQNRINSNEHYKAKNDMMTFGSYDLFSLTMGA